MKYKVVWVTKESTTELERLFNDEWSVMFNVPTDSAVMVVLGKQSSIAPVNGAVSPFTPKK